MSTYIREKTRKKHEKPVFCFQFSDVSWLWRWRIWRLKSSMSLDPYGSKPVWGCEAMGETERSGQCMFGVGPPGWAAAIRWVFWRPIKIISTHSKRPMNMWVFSWLASTRWKTIGWKPPKWRFRKLRSFSKRWFCTILDVICHGFFYLGSDCIKTHKSGYTRQVVSIDPKTVPTFRFSRTPVESRTEVLPFGKTRGPAIRRHRPYFCILLLKRTFWPLKIIAWKMNFPLGNTPAFGGCFNSQFQGVGRALELCAVGRVNLVNFPFGDDLFEGSWLRTHNSLFHKRHV